MNLRVHLYLILECIPEFDPELIPEFGLESFPEIHPKLVPEFIPEFIPEFMPQSNPEFIITVVLQGRLGHPSSLSVWPLGPLMISCAM